MSTGSLQALLALVLVFGLANTSAAALAVYEPFDYASGSELTGQNGGGGWGADWTGRANDVNNVPANSTEIQANSLVYAGLPTSGGSVLITGANGTAQPARDFSAVAKNVLSNAPTTWISFIAQRQGDVTDPNNSNWPENPYPRGVNVSFFLQDVATDDELIGVGNSSNAIDNTWSLIPDGSGGQREGAYDPPGGIVGGGPENVGAATFPWNEQQWAVVRIDHHAGPDDVYLWLSPDPNVEPAFGDADATILSTDANALDYADIGALRPFIGNESSSSGNADWRPAGVLALDELRIGTTYGDMTGTRVVPEPTSLALLALSGLAGLLARRRAR